MKSVILVLLSAAFSVRAEGGTNTPSHYDPGELLAKIFNPNIQSKQLAYGSIKFDEQDKPNNDNSHKLVFNDQNKQSLRFEDHQKLEYSPSFEHHNYGSYPGPQEFGSSNYNFGQQAGVYQGSSNGDENSGLGSQSSGIIHFQDENNLEGQKQESGPKKRRRRRKPKYQGPKLEYPGYPGPLVMQGLGPKPFVNPGFYRPPPRLEPSLASQALSAVTEALTSIALYDDYQCVPRLLCEAAGGGALGSPGFLQSAVGLQPLLTLLSAYNGISSSPLFVFGRAVFLGMTSKGNTGTCRYAYSQCPTDPEQLVHYLNNHNGGFFRFFNAPQNQNLEQFYNQLSGQGQYGFYQPGQTQFGQNPGSDPQNLYINQQHYGSGYPYDNSGVNFNRLRFKENQIEKRIQNKPSSQFVDEDFEQDKNSKWLFPDVDNYDKDNNLIGDITNNNREEKRLRFPEDTITNVVTEPYRRGKNIYFPNDQRTDRYSYTTSFQVTTPSNPNNYVFDHKHNFYVEREKEDDDGVRTIYVVRGHGDPNNPEIIKVRPGQTYF